MRSIWNTMPLDQEQALDEATHRKVEGALDCLRIAARQIQSEAGGIRSDGGEERLAALLEETSEEVLELLKRVMSHAYFTPPEADDLAALDEWKKSLPAAERERHDADQASLFGDPGEDTLAA